MRWLALVALLAACGGDEVCAQGDCPEPGNDCDSAPPPRSPLTPFGLQFVARAGGSSWPVMAGGTQTYSIRNADGSAFGHTYELTALCDTIDVTWESSEYSQFTVRANTEGRGVVRVTDSETGEWFDDVALEARPLERILVEPASETTVPGQASGWLLMVGGTPLRVTLFGGGSELLTNANLEASIDEVEALSSDWWDIVLARAENVGEHAFAVSAPAGDVEADLVVVDSLDEILPLTTASLSLVVDESRLVCFRGKKDGFDVYGVDFDYEGLGSVGAHAGDRGGLGYDNCGEVRGVEEGAGTVVVSAGGASLEIPATVTSAP